MYVCMYFLAVPVYMYRDIDVIKAGGIELRGMKASLAPRRQQSQAAPKLEKYTFVPYTAEKVINFDSFVHCTFLSMILAYYFWGGYI